MSRLVYKNFIYLFIVQFSNYILPFLVLPLLTRALGVEGYGKYAFYLGLANFLLVFIRFGFEFSATRQISINSEKPQEVSKIVSAVLQIKLLLLLICCFLYWGLVTFLKPDEQHLNLMLGGFLLLAGQMLLPIWYFQGMQQMRYVTLYTIITKIVYVGALFALIREQNDYGLAVIIYGGAFFVAGTLAIIQVFKQSKLTFRPDFLMIKKVFNEALPYFSSRVFVAVYTSSLIPLLGFIGGPAQVAIYSASEKLYLAAQSVMHPLTNALFPHVSKNRDITLFKKLFTLAMLIVIIGGIAGYFIAPYLITLLFGADFIASVQIFNIHIIALIFVFPSLMLGYPLLAALGYSKAANYSVIIGCIVFFSLALIGYLLNIKHTEYFVWSVVAAEVSVFIIRAYYAFIKVIKNTEDLNRDDKKVN